MSEPHKVGPAMTREEWRAARLAALDAGAYTIGRAALSGPTFTWSRRDWCNAVTFTDRILIGIDNERG